MWWKIYFWIITIISIIGLFGLLGHSPLIFGDLIGFVLNVLMLIGVYAYVFKKKIFSASIWKIIFWLNVILFVIAIVDLYFLPGFTKQYLSFLESKVSSAASSGAIVFTLVLTLPTLYAMYKLGYEKGIVSAKRRK